MANIEQLTDDTVEEQAGKLENLETSELKQLREQETRRTAVQNIDSELENREDNSNGDTQEEKTSSETEDEPVESDTDQSQQEEDKSNKEQDTRGGDTAMSKDDRIAELEAKVDYLFENVKTVSKQGYRNEN